MTPSPPGLPGNQSTIDTQLPVMTTAEFVPSIENVLDSNPVSWDADGNRLVSWEVNGGWAWVPYAELRKACEAAYDSTMPSWPAMVEIAA